ncbi:MAG TPA: glycoside hydrolase family 16 protein [Ramlibacter sp.]|nr:glycoside hydrolase family 16 protein [Ramlibacter sp.]
MADWQLQHEERFAAGRPLDAGFWRLESGFHRNREDQYYAPGNVTVQDGLLRFEARREEVPNADWQAGSRDWRRSRRTSSYTSGSIVSRAPLHFGRVEVVARNTGGAGVWPAIWLVHEAAGLYGEIDLFEYVGKHPETVFAGVHWGRDPRTRRHRNDWKKVAGFEGRWATHSLEWTPSAITISLDGQPWFRFDPEEARLRGGGDPLRQPMHLRLNLALGGSWGGAIDEKALPARFEVASIRVWRWAPGARADGTPPAQAAAPPPAPAPAAAAPIAPAPAPPPDRAPVVPLPASESTAPGNFRWGR